MTEQKITLPITMESKVQTRNGQKVTLYCVDAPGGYPIHGRVEGEYEAQSWNCNGRLGTYSTSAYDLIDAPKTVRVQGYLNVYADGLHTFHATKETADLYSADLYSADLYSASNRIACIEIDMEIEEGRFDE